MSEFVPITPALLLSNDAARKSLSDMLRINIVSFSDQVWPQIHDTNELLFDILDVHVDGLENSADQEVEITASQVAFRIGSCAAYFAFSFNENPDLPVVGDTATRFAKTKLEKHGETSLAIGSLLVDPNLTKLITAIKSFHNDIGVLNLNSHTENQVDTGAGFTRLLLDTQVQVATSAQFN